MIDKKNLISALAGAGLAVSAVFALQAANAPTPKAYVLGEIDVHDAEAYKPYGAAALPLVTKYGGVYLARGGRTVPLEGAAPAGRIVVVEFPSLAAAQAFEDSAEYRNVAKIRQKASTGRLFIVEGTAP